jgi:molybdopterin-guanine dinucleotide biosynthesis protein A
MTLIPYQNVTAFVLAGGASERMGQDKALLKLAGMPMVMRAARLAQPYVASVTIVAPEERYAHLDVHILSDRWPGAGPLGGIATALGSTSSEWNLILGCDLPNLTPEWLAWIISRALESSAHAVVPESGRGLEPMAAMYRQSCGAILTAAVERGVRRVTEGLSDILFERVSLAEWREFDPTGTLFENMNTLEDYFVARRRIEDLASP